MLTDVCQELNNWFDRDQPRIYGAFEISGGHIVDEDFTNVIKPNQYFRIIGSVFNDGVYKYTDELTLTDELFTGSIWLMAVPKAVISLSDEIDAWVTKYADAANNPYASESFGGYSYTKSNTGTGTWQSIFGARLSAWRKL